LATFIFDKGYRTVAEIEQWDPEHVERSSLCLFVDKRLAHPCPIYVTISVASVLDQLWVASHQRKSCVTNDTLLGCGEVLNALTFSSIMPSIIVWMLMCQIYAMIFAATLALCTNVPIYRRLNSLLHSTMANAVA
jgi:hypothetical protein